MTATIKSITTKLSQFDATRISEMLPTWADQTIEYTHRWINSIEVVYEDGDTMTLCCDGGYIAPASYDAHDGFLWFVTHALSIIAASKKDNGCYNNHYDVNEIKQFKPTVDLWCTYSVGKSTPSDFDSVVKNHYAARKLLDAVEHLHNTTLYAWGADINIEQWLKSLKSSGSDHNEIVVEED